MAQFLPLTLSGGNLGERHRYLNSQVRQAAISQVSPQDIGDLPEHTPVDRLFKIDLAIKLENVDYILENLKDDDLLYVSRALKCKWLVERRDIINPKYLEELLFPQMVLPAISKMKHWLYINLREPLMCLDFYQYYKERKFGFAVKFLSHCDNEFVVTEFPKILIKITPHQLKVLGEKYPKLVETYFEALATDDELVKRYLNDEQHFYNNIKHMLKSDPEAFLNIVEKYHYSLNNNKLSPSATDYIMRCHKNIVMGKLELYVVYLLHMPTVASRLTAAECQEVVLKLARADYISWWFLYANVEPLVKRVNRESRAAFKKRVFVDKDVGERVSDWPYKLPASPAVSGTNADELHVFDDQEYEPVQLMRSIVCGRRMLKRKMGYFGDTVKCEAMISACRPIKSDLQKLFDEFRFKGFSATLHAARTLARAASSAARRRDLLLLLVSKSGGRAGSVRALLQLALRMRNEPARERAAVVRSLVRRASVWRLPREDWEALRAYAGGLLGDAGGLPGGAGGLPGGAGGLPGGAGGLPGGGPACREGLHAAVLRRLVACQACPPPLRAAFLEDFSPLVEYKLLASERVNVAEGLQNILVTAAAEADPETAAVRLNQLLDVLEKYHVSLASSSAVSIVTALAQRDFEVAKPLLVRLYDARVGRRELLCQYLEFRHDDAALLNALRHDPAALKPEWIIKLLTDGKSSANQFFLKLALYFKESGGSAEQFRQALQNQIAQEPDVRLARPLATLAGSDMRTIWREQDVTLNDARYKLAAALRANMHRARPAPDAVALGWRKTGMKALAWRAVRCRPAQVTQLVHMLLEERVKRTMRLALALAQRTDCAADIFSTAVTIRPLAALRAALLYFRSVGDAADLRIWDAVKPFISSADLAPRDGLRHILKKVETVPKIIKGDYCAYLYLALHKISDQQADFVLSELMKCLPDVGDEMKDKVLLQMLENIDRENPESYPAIVIRYLMLSKNDNEQTVRFEKIGEPFLEKVVAFRNEKDEILRQFFSRNLDQVVASLQYNFAFFDAKYECCLAVIEKVLTWMHQFMPKETHFDQYVKIHATMLFYKAVRQSMKRKPEVFQHTARKMSDGVEIVGFTFGRYVAKELAELMTKYFDSVIELYRSGFKNYMNEYFMFGTSRTKYLGAVTKGILSEAGNASRLAVHVLRECQYNLDGAVLEEVKELLIRTESKETQFFAYAQIFV